MCIERAEQLVRIYLAPHFQFLLLVRCKQGCVSLEREFHLGKGTFRTPSVSGLLYRRCGAVMCLMHMLFVSWFISRGSIAGT